MHVLFHNNCFDGACSASLFTRFYRECIDPSASFTYQGLQHAAGGGISEADLSGKQNAIVDFKYLPSPKLTWWFDHHVSAFMTPEYREYFEAEQKRTAAHPQQFFDPTYTSCAGLIADVGRTKFGFDTAPYADLLHWADIIDGAKFPSAEEAVTLAAPAMKIATAIEAAQDPAFIPRIIPLLTEQSLVQTEQELFVQAVLEPRLVKQQQDVTLMRSRASADKGVITFDLTDQNAEGYSKFIPYYLLPEAVYAVGLSKSSSRVKVSVGTSPWTTVAKEKLADIAAICERFGGGGHPRVGAISLPAGDLDGARRIAAIVADELKALGQWNELPTRPSFHGV